MRGRGVPDRGLALEEADVQRMPKPTACTTRIAFVTGCRPGIGKAVRVDPGVATASLP